MTGPGLWWILSLSGDSGFSSLLSSVLGESWRCCGCFVTGDGRSFALAKRTGADGEKDDGLGPPKAGRRTRAAGGRGDELGPPKAGGRAWAAGRRGGGEVELGPTETVSVTSPRRLLFGFSEGLPVREVELPVVAGEVNCWRGGGLVAGSGSPDVTSPPPKLRARPRVAWHTATLGMSVYHCTWSGSRDSR